MKVYEMRIKDETGAVISAGATSAGSNAVEAFENAIDAGVVNVPSGEFCKVLAVNTETGIAIEFKSARAL